MTSQDSIRDSMHESPKSCFSDPSKWCHSQLYGWKPDADGQYHGIWKRWRQAHFWKLVSGDHLDIEEVDATLSTVAFVSSKQVLLLVAIVISSCVGG